MRDLFGDEQEVVVDAGNVRQLIDQLESRYPGAKVRLVQNGELVPGLAVVINGQAATLGLLQKLKADDEVHFLPALGGG